MWKRSASRRLAPVVVLFAALIAGCAEKPKPPQAGGSDAGADASAATMRRPEDQLTEALTAAAKEGGDAATDGGEGPPANGVLSPAEADRVLARGAPPRLDLLSEGSGEKSLLLAPVEGGAERRAVLSVSVRLGMQVLPTIDFALLYRVEKAKAGEAARPLAVEAVVQMASLAAQQPARIPPELAQPIGKLKGSKVRFRLASGGAASEYAHELAAGADPGLEAALRGLVDALSTFVVPVPAKPVGTGAYWAITERLASSGSEVVRYRLARVQKLEGGIAELVVESKQYAVGDAIDLGAGSEGKGLGIDRYEAVGKAIVELGVTQFLPTGGEVQQRIQAQLKSAAQPNQRSLFAAETAAALEMSDLTAAAKGR